MSENQDSHTYCIWVSYTGGVTYVPGKVTKDLTDPEVIDTLLSYKMHRLDFYATDEDGNRIALPIETLRAIGQN